MYWEEEWTGSREIKSPVRAPVFIFLLGKMRWSEQVISKIFRTSAYFFFMQRRGIQKTLDGDFSTLKVFLKIEIHISTSKNM